MKLCDGSHSAAKRRETGILLDSNFFQTANGENGGSFIRIQTICQKVQAEAM